MTYEELKRRIKDEGLDQYGTYAFDRMGGVYVATCIWKNSNGTVSYCFTDERGSAFAEHLNIPEGEACDQLYSLAHDAKGIAEYRTNRSRPDQPAG